MKNKLGDLNNHLFAQLERLSDESIKGEALLGEIRRAHAITNIAKEIIDNGKLVGSERISSGDGCILIKVAEPNVWKYKHKMMWESKYGKIPQGDVVRFKDSNQLNCVMDNLEKVDRQVHLYLNRNGYTEMPGKFKPTMKAIALIKTKIYKIQGQTN